MTVLVRFAPSPTGRLHVGNIYIALANWLFARSRGGEFLLRLDDTDRERSTAAFAEGIEADLRWLGLAWNRFARQSEGMERYDTAVATLKAADRLYPCYETPEELALKRKSQLQRGRPPVYDRAARALTDADRQRLEAEGRRPHWRFLLARESVAWTDLVRGEQQIDEASQSDPVLVREDGSYLYTLPSVVDDIAFGVSHVIRGSDHITNTGAQIQLFRALGAEPPAFAHLPLLSDAAGEGLSKRLGSLSIDALREQGTEAMAINSYLARIGTADSVEPKLGLDDLVQGFDISRFGRAAPRFDPAELAHLNARLLHETPFAAVRARLEAMGLAQVDEELWQAVRGNIATLAEIADWAQVCHGPVTPVIEDPAFAATAADLLPSEPWDQEVWGAWTARVREATGRKGKALFLPLRLALTGREHGPELKNLLPLIGRARAVARLSGQTG
ncbi:glutamate--tRNA ligase [Rhodospirillaceae bacterium SYSU D60014]|uniref:glutamate--tRNA ligase n=1 Tax=Virgifigura deserti TaxID=2268457 RepID=UPI000E671A08